MKMKHFTAVLRRALEKSCEIAIQHEQCILYDEHILLVLVLEQNRKLSKALSAENISISGFKEYLLKRIKSFSKRKRSIFQPYISVELSLTLHAARKTADKEKVNEKHFIKAFFTTNRDFLVKFKK